MLVSTFRRGAGRKSKDQALVLRCQYVALHVRSREPKGYPYLDELLHAGTGPASGERADGGTWHQGMWRKRARGEKGFSGTIGDVPPVISMAERHYPGTLARYQSALWATLWSRGDWKDRFERIHWALPDSVREALAVQGTQRSDNALLSGEEIERVGELTSLDAFGWLLMHVMWLGEAGRKPALLAQKMYWRLMEQDSEFASLHENLSGLVKDRFGVWLEPMPPPPPPTKTEGRRPLQVRQSALERIARNLGTSAQKIRAARELRAAQMIERSKRMHRLRQV